MRYFLYSTYHIINIFTNFALLYVNRIEKGAPTVSIGIYAHVLYVLQLDDDILLIAKEDTLGRTLQDLSLKHPQRASKKSKRCGGQVFPPAPPQYDVSSCDRRQCVVDVNIREYIPVRNHRRPPRYALRHPDG